MKNFFLIVFTFVALGVVFFLFQDPILQALSTFKPKPMPCENPITYSIGTFDKKFGISKEKFISIVDKAEKTWEGSIDKQLFTYKEDGSGDLKINLIYDDRQEASQKLKDIGISVSNSKASYNDLKSKYSSMQIDYLNSKNELGSRVVLFKNRQSTYEKEVTHFNANGGATKEDFNRLTKEKNYLDSEFSSINKLQAELSIKVNNLNAMVIVLNKLVSSLNIEVTKFNTIGDQLGGEFEEGTYISDVDGKRINIYQYDDEGKLARVLTHEFGHALGLEHLEAPKAVMYRLNNGINEKLTVEDIVALKNRCNIVTQLKK